MDKNSRDFIVDAMERISDSVDQLYHKLSGRPLTARSLAEAMQEMGDDPSVPVEELEKTCEELLEGVRTGAAYAEQLMNISEEELDGFLPDYLQQSLKGMDADCQHQYLILVYQALREHSDERITSSEMVKIANTSNTELLDKIADLLHLVQTEEAYETIQLLNRYVGQTGSYEQLQDTHGFTREEQNWIVAAAMYLELQPNQVEKIPAQIIGETVGASVTAGQNFRTCMLQKVIPAVVATLAVVAICAVAFLCIQAIVTHSLFATAAAWMQAHYSTSFLRTALIFGLCAVAKPVSDALQTVWDKTFTATAEITCRYRMEDAQQQYAQLQAEGAGAPAVFKSVDNTFEYGAIPVEEEEEDEEEYLESQYEEEV